jgi:hypothetical protein
MSFGFPFPSDRLALARTDFCESPDAMTRPHWTQRTCMLRARQCATHVQATGDRAWARRAAPALGELVAAGEVTGWGGAAGCVHARAQGACGLLGTRDPDYRRQLWRQVGRPRAEALYRAVEGSSEGSSQGEDQADARGDGPTPLQGAPFGSRQWVAQHYAAEAPGWMW